MRDGSAVGLDMIRGSRCPDLSSAGVIRPFQVSRQRTVARPDATTHYRYAHRPVHITRSGSQTTGVLLRFRFWGSMVVWTTKEVVEAEGERDGEVVESGRD